MVVAIDGPAGTGKSTISRRIAEQAGFFYLNSGRFYRAITWKALQHGLTPADRDALIDTARGIRVELSGDAYLIDGVRREEELHSSAVDAAVAQVSAIPEVREAVNTRIRLIAGQRDIVVEGRDMSTIVFPEAEVKVFLDADLRERARRRHAQQPEADFASILAAIAARDEVDTTKESGRLERRPDARYIDTTHLTIDRVCEMVVGIIHEKQDHGRSS